MGLVTDGLPWNAPVMNASDARSNAMARYHVSGADISIWSVSRILFDVYEGE